VFAFKEKQVPGFRQDLHEDNRMRNEEGNPMKQKATKRRKLIDAIERSRHKGADFVCYPGHENPVRIDSAIEYLERMPEDLAGISEQIARWYECDSAGNRIIRVREIYGGLTRHVSGVIVWDGSADVFCGEWVGLKGMPRSFGPPDPTGEGRMLVAKCLEPERLDDDARELVYGAAYRKGDKSPTLHEVFRVNELATIVTFDSWP
jgi:hypothetical protein